jgi:hypothetical protein
MQLSMDMMFGTMVKSRKQPGRCWHRSKLPGDQAKKISDLNDGFTVKTARRIRTRVSNTTSRTARMRNRQGWRRAGQAELPSSRRLTYLDWRWRPPPNTAGPTRAPAPQAPGMPPRTTCTCVPPMLPRRTEGEMMEEGHHHEYMHWWHVYQEAKASSGDPGCASLMARYAVTPGLSQN